MANAQRLDFTTTCQSFPEPLTSPINRDNFLNSIESAFEGDTQLFIFEGDEGVGKTTLLTHFALRHPFHTLSLFIRSTSRWAYDPDSLRFDLCNQLHWFFTKEELKSNEVIDEAFLRNGWLNLHKHARRNREKFFFVVDGLNDIPEEELHIRKIILDMLPLGHSAFYFLFAGTASKILPNISSKINYKTSLLPGFTLPDTIEYLKDFALEREVVEEIYKVCLGMPSHLASVKRILLTDIDVNTLLENMPDKLPDLFEFEWRRVTDDNNQQRLLAIMAYDLKEHSKHDLARILNIDVSIVQTLLQDLGFVNINYQSHEVKFVSEAFRKFVASRLQYLKENVKNLLIDDLFKLPISDNALNFLPGYLEQAERFDELISYLSLDNFTTLLERSQSLSPMQRMAQLGIRASTQLKRDGDLMRFSLQRSAIANLNGAEIWRSEIEAKMALNKYEAALALAQRTILKEDRLHLLAIIAKMKREKGLTPEAELTEQIRQLYDQIERSSLGERAIEIASDLMHCYPDLAIKLVEEATNTDTSENALDLAFAKLSLSALNTNKEQYQESGTIEMIHSRIKDPDFRRISSSASLLLNSYSSAQVIAEAKKFESVGDALFILSLWAMDNREHFDAVKVVDFGLKLAIKTTAYSPNARILRKIAMPLPFITEESEVKRLVDNFDSQRGTIERLGPTVDYVRLQLLLAEAECKYDFEAASDRIIDTYFYIVNLCDLAMKTECLAWLVATITNIDPHMSFEIKEGIHSLAQDDLLQNVKLLLDNTANHPEVIRGIVRALAKTKSEMALNLTQSLNTEESRDSSLLYLLNAIINMPVALLNLSFIENTICLFADQRSKNEAVLSVLTRLAKIPNIKEQLVIDVMPIINRIKDIPEADVRCEAYCFAYSFLVKQETNKYKSLASDLLKYLKTAWQGIDKEWEKIDRGFKAVTIISSGSLEEAQKFLSMTEKFRSEVVLDADTNASTYIYCLQLATRSFKGLLSKNLDRDEDIEVLDRLISRIASNGIRAMLWSDLAIHCYNNDRNKKCQFIIDHYIRSLFDNISNEDIGSKNFTMVVISPALYCAHKQTTLEQVSILPPPFRDDAFYLICRFIFCKYPTSDPYDYISNEGFDISYNEIVEICTILNLLDSDTYICSVIETIADSITGRNKNKLNFLQTNDIISRLEKIISNKLPMRRGIKHEGYKIAALAQIARIRNAPIHTWIELSNSAHNIPNFADKALVLSLLAEAMPKKESIRRNQLVIEAKEIIEQMPRTLDKIKRYRILASITANIEPAMCKEYLKLAMKTTTDIDSSDMYSAQKKIIDLAYRLDPGLAASIASIVNDDPARSKLERRIKVLDLQKKMIDQKTEDGGVSAINSATIPKFNYSEAAWSLLGALNAKRAAELHIDRLREFFQVAASLPLDQSFAILAWIIENMVKCYAKTDQASKYLRPLFDALLVSTELVGRTAIHSVEQLRQNKDRIIKTAEDTVHLIRAGERDVALQFLKDWFAKRVHDYLKICDQYFGPDDLDVLQLLLTVNPTCKVYILTSKKQQDHEGIGMDCSEAYRTRWHFRFVQEPPDTDITVIGTKRTGEAPIHDRWWLTNGGGINVGTSFNGLGNQDSKITILSPEEAEVLEKDMDQYYYGHKREYKGEKLIRTVFTLY